MVRREGKMIKRERPLAYQYVFIKGTPNEVKKLCSLDNGLSFVINRSCASRYATLTDPEMDQFRRVAMALGNELPFYDIADINLEEGDKVEIVEGTFPGLVGYYIPRPKSDTGEVVLAVTQSMGTVIYDIKARYVRVLEFSKHSRRSYDQIDAYVPRLLAALRYYAERQTLPDKLATELTIFVRRMGSVRLDNRKLEAKLLGLLTTSYHILGNETAAAATLERLTDRFSSVTSPQTKSLLLLLRAVTDLTVNPASAHVTYSDGFALLQPQTDDTNTTQRPAQTKSLSKAHRLLLDEYTHYAPMFSM